MNLLLHVCCAPCMTSFHKYFEENEISYTGFFYNPNIHPYKEFVRRMNTLKEYSQKIGLEVIYDMQFEQVKWETEFAGLTTPERCTECYKMRIARVAKEAAEKGFTHFTTTLLISPYQNHDFIIETGKKEAAKNGVEFFYRDFREYFREGQNIAREDGMYRQKYCGCIYSYNTSKFKDKITWD